ncbi:hypothetical protein [Acidovorax sp. JHL-3]|uniref:hypothetical protein n=1 Tax=Acidovorax sp. JHL-3 TaxID=1276755 RepID=UPI0012DD47D4|nr:hypothetical protein [Acidovorax sp. JHL-3]
MEQFILLVLFFASLYVAPRAGRAIGFLMSDHRSVEVNVILAVQQGFVSSFWMKFSFVWFILLICNGYISVQLLGWWGLCSPAFLIFAMRPGVAEGKRIAYLIDKTVTNTVREFKEENEKESSS